MHPHSRAHLLIVAHCSLLLHKYMLWGQTSASLETMCRTTQTGLWGSSQSSWHKWTMNQMDKHEWWGQPQLASFWALGSHQEHGDGKRRPFSSKLCCKKSHNFGKNSSKTPICSTAIVNLGVSWWIHELSCTVSAFKGHHLGLAHMPAQHCPAWILILVLHWKSIF